jgi:beta-lactamase regulating signal transducer with metallopeptidase domain
LYPVWFVPCVVLLCTLYPFWFVPSTQHKVQNKQDTRY